MPVMFVALLRLTCNQGPVPALVLQALGLFRRASVTGQHFDAPLLVKAESEMERSRSPSGELHSVEHQKQRENFLINLWNSQTLSSALFEVLVRFVKLRVLDQIVSLTMFHK